MLSNPPPSASNLHSRQRLHRRQNSTPTAFEAVKIAPLPNYRYNNNNNNQSPQQQHQQQQQRSHVSHRRGMSLDTRRLQLQQRQQQPQATAMATTRQDFSPVSTPTNNQGLSTTPQHVMRETQQQRTARLGPSQPFDNGNNANPSNNYAGNSRRNHAVNRRTNNISRSSCHSRNSSTSSIGSINHFGIDENNNFLISPHGTPQSQRFVNVVPVNNRQMEDMSMSFGPYLSQMNAMMQKNQQQYDNGPGQDFELYAPDSALSTPTFMTFAEASPSQSPQGWISEGEATSSRRSSRRVSNGILDRVAKFENMGPEPIQVGRPYTPPGQNDNMYYPPTPMDTPHDRMVKHDQRPNRFSDDYDESLEETIKPGRGHRSNRRNNGVFEQMRQQAEAMERQQSGHQRTNTMSSQYTDSGMSTADFIDMTNMDQFVKIEGDYEEYSSSNNNNNLNISQNSPPMHPHMAVFTMNGAFNQKPPLQPHEVDSQETVRPAGNNSSSAQSSRRGSPHRRTESIASIVSAASISSINIEETKTDTGVTIDEIQTFIDGPDAEAKWTCTYESCGKKFGRKENIKSHVQTHLNDRQYQCPTCKKCFVRQHDLKRHAKIHTGIKPYPCECGNSFARHDALTRHRQRGMCIGAFDGIVRKVVKRGRPRKYRPEMEDRLVKSEQTRRKNRASANGSQHSHTPSSASSQSGYSDSSAGNSPSHDNDFDGVLDDAPFPDMDMMDVGNMGSAAITSAALSMHQQNLSLGPTTSRAASTKTLSPATISSAFMPTSSSFEDNNSSSKYDVTSVSPEQITAASPSTMSNYSFHGLPTLPMNHNPPNNHPKYRASPEPAAAAFSPAKSTASSTNYTHQPGTPPELSASSSPPPTTTTTAQADSLPQPRYFDLDDVSDFDPNASGLSDHSIGLGTTAAAHAAVANMSAGLVDVDDEMLLGAYGSHLSHEDRLAQFHQAERDLMMGGGGKGYFEDVDEVALFTNVDDVDVFFGSS